MKKRLRIKQTLSFKDRLALFAKGVRKRADDLPPGPTKEDLLLKVSQAETAAHLDDWIKSPGLQRPK